MADRRTPIIPAVPKVDQSTTRPSQVGADEKLRSATDAPNPLQKFYERKAAGQTLQHPTHTTWPSKVTVP